MSETPGSLQNSEAEAQRRIVRAERNTLGQLVVYLEGRDEPIVDARIARCFPWSVPHSYISVRDSNGKELVLLKTLDELPAESRSLLEAELRDKIFNPKIRRIIDYKHEFGITSITARTDRGEVTFQVRGRDDVRVLSPTRALFRDADGNTYELPDLRKLPPSDQRNLQRYF